MLDLNTLRCVGCGAGGLQRVADFLSCPVCGRTYPVLADVPVMVSDASVLRGPLVDPAAAGVVLQAMGLPNDPIDVLRIRRAFGARAKFGSTEGGCAPFLARMRNAGFAVPDFNPPPPDGEADDDAEPPRCEWITDYIPRALPPGQDVLANVRFRNGGAATMRHARHDRITIASEWRNAQGEIVPYENIRTPLPRDLAPGEAITMPVCLRPPHRAGLYSLSLQMVQEGAHWLKSDYGPVRIHLRPDAAFVPPPHWQINGGESGHASADRERALASLRGWLAGFGPAPLVLEMSGCPQPLAATLPGGAYNADLDLLSLQIGCVVSRARGNGVHHVCADACNLPFPPAFFDAVIFFGSLHRYPDPAAALRGLSLHLRPGGFIGVFCEPAGHVWPGAVPPDFMARLPSGVNEQRFSMAEYAGIFRAARLDAVEVVADHGVLTARLAPSG